MVTVALPFAFGAGVYVSVPLAETAGCALKRALFPFEVTNVSVCEASFGPAEMDVAQPATVCGPASSFTA